MIQMILTQEILGDGVLYNFLHFSVVFFFYGMKLKELMK